MTSADSPPVPEVTTRVAYSGPEPDFGVSTIANDCRPDGRGTATASVRPAATVTSCRGAGGVTVPPGAIPLPLAPRGSAGAGGGGRGGGRGGAVSPAPAP